MVQVFKKYDKNGDGTMDAEQLKDAIVDLGHSEVTEQDLQNMLKKFDNDGVILWTEFVHMGIQLEEAEEKAGDAND